MRKLRNLLHPTERRPLSLPAEFGAGGPFIELRGRREVSVQGCRKILLCEPDEVRLALECGMLSVVGRGLCCATYFAGAVSIRGVIVGLSFADGEGAR